MLANTYFSQVEVQHPGMQFAQLCQKLHWKHGNGLLSMTKGAGKCSWWPEINPEVSNVVTPGQFAIINCWYILLHFTLKRSPKRIHEDFFGLTRISSHSNFASHILRIRWREVTDGATNRMLSTYNNILIYFSERTNKTYATYYISTIKIWVVQRDTVV